MTETERPDPDALLQAQLKREEAKSTRGKLKIFFGMSPGVGKTYAMCSPRVEKQAEGCEVVDWNCGDARPQRNGGVAGRHANHAAFTG